MDSPFLQSSYVRNLIQALKVVWECHADREESQRVLVEMDELRAG